MSDLTDYKNLDYGDLADVCKAKGIKVTDKDNRDTLREKLMPKPKVAKK